MYEPYLPKDERRRRRRGGCLPRLLFKLIAFVVLAALLCAGVLYALPVSLFLVEPEADLTPTDGLPSTPFNVLVLGVDSENYGASRSDAMLVATIDYKSLKMTSLQRDMVVPIEGHGTGKLNAAYAYGGPELAVRTINQVFGLNIVRYAVVDFKVVVKLVDALGGVDIDISEEEMHAINDNVALSWLEFVPLGYREVPLTEYGPKTHLDGIRALAYSRIRKIDSDFQRMGRQRVLIGAVLEKLRANLWNPAMLVSFIRAGLSGVETNLSVVELLSLGEKAAMARSMDSLRVPVNGSYRDDGSRLVLTDEAANRQAIRSFLYGS